MLLFLSSFLGLGLGLLQLVCESIAVLVFFLPLLILILVVPIYIGYIRGAILLDSIVERIRGWFYLILCGGYYTGSAVIFSIVDYYGFFERSDLFSSVISLVTFFSIPVVTVFVFRYSQSTVNLFFKIFGYKQREESEEINHVILFTLMAAVFLALASLCGGFMLPGIIEKCITEEGIIQKIVNIVVCSLFIGITIVSIIEAISLEREARYWSKKAEEAQKLEIKSG